MRWFVVVLLVLILFRGIFSLIFNVKAVHTVFTPSPKWTCTYDLCNTRYTDKVIWERFVDCV